MENISETVVMCMIAIAAIQFVIILTIIKYGDKKNHSDYADNKRSVIELLNSSSGNSDAAIKECC